MPEALAADTFLRDPRRPMSDNRVAPFPRTEFCQELLRCLTQRNHFR